MSATVLAGIRRFWSRMGNSSPRIFTETKIVDRQIATPCKWQGMMTVKNKPSAVYRAARSVLHLSREISHWPYAIRPGRGHRVAFLPSAEAKGAALLRIYNVAQNLRRQGWSTLVIAPKLTLDQRRRLLGWMRPEVIVMQGARHDMNRPELYPGTPIAYDMDDADFHLPHLEEPVLHAMTQVDLIIAGSRYIADWSRDHGAKQATVIWTGTEPSLTPESQISRPPVIAWAQTRPADYRREAALVRQVMSRVAAQRPGSVLRLYDRGPEDDQSFADSFAAEGLSVEWQRTTSYKSYLESFDDVAIGLAPLCPETPFSRGKSFGKVLAYLDRGVPVVGSDAGEHGAFFTPETGVITNDEDAMVSSITTLLDDPARRQAMATRARHEFLARLTTQVAARRLGDAIRAHFITQGG